ncbi:helix-turn-helix domain-containing protein [Paenibacillus sp. P25]|nr:helix-turn-helix domain-containing protein [Paenibacillus sp. P25]
MKATIYDVAREAGVSIATVSQVINGKGKISEERRNEIIQIMERLQYQPSVIAAALTGKKTYTLGRSSLTSRTRSLRRLPEPWRIRDISSATAWSSAVRTTRTSGWSATCPCFSKRASTA